MGWVKCIATEQHSEEVSRGQKEIRPIHGKIGFSVAIRNPGPDATAGSGSCPSADCQSGATAASACPHFPKCFPKHHETQLLGHMSSSFCVQIIFDNSIQEIRCWIFLFIPFFFFF